MFLANHAACLVIAASAVVLTAAAASVVYPSFWPEGDPFWLRTELVAEKRDYPSGENIPMKLSLSNPGAQPVRLFFSDSCRIQWFVYNIDGELVRGNYTVRCSFVETDIRLMPGQTVEFPIAWDQRDNEGNQVPGGSYMVVAWVMSSVSYSTATVVGAGR